MRALVAEAGRSSARRPKEPRRVPRAGTFARHLASHGFLVGAEIAPQPNGADGDPADAVAVLRDQGAELVLVAAAEVGSAQSSSASLALHVERHAGVETVPTITTWDKTIMSLQADLLGAHAVGTRKVLCETGNPAFVGDYPRADGVWDVDAIGLIELLAGLNEGRDCNGLPLATRTSFEIGARCNPGAEDLDAEIARTRAKVAAGAEFLVTRPLYDLEGLRRLMTALGDDRIPVLVTVSPLNGFAEAEYLAYEVPDVAIPPETLADLSAAGDADREVAGRLAIHLVAYLVTHARSLADGIVVSAGDDNAVTQAMLAAAHA
jgi:homocysteine S-methyltransferase